MRPMADAERGRRRRRDIFVRVGWLVGGVDWRDMNSGLNR